MSQLLIRSYLCGHEQQAQEDLNNLKAAGITWANHWWGKSMEKCSLQQVDIVTHFL